MKPAVFGMCAALLLALAPAQGQTAATQSAEASLLHGQIRYTPPETWRNAPSNAAADMAATYLAPDHDGLLLIEVLPENAVISPQAGSALVVKLRANHKKAGQAIVMDPTVEKDARFSIRIHEKYKTKDGATADELHLYRKVGSQAVSVTVQSLSEDQKHIDVVHRAGEETLLSARARKS
jgi:hypothetical protein